jgi:hypothetical protein
MSGATRMAPVVLLRIAAAVRHPLASHRYFRLHGARRRAPLQGGFHNTALRYVLRMPSPFALSPVAAPHYAGR